MGRRSGCAGGYSNHEAPSEPSAGDFLKPKCKPRAPRAARDLPSLCCSPLRGPKSTAHATAHSRARFHLPLARGKESRPPAQSQTSPSTPRWTRHRRPRRARSSSTVAPSRSRTRTTTPSRRLQTEVRARAKKFRRAQFSQCLICVRSHRRGDGPRPQGGGEGAGEDELALRGQRSAGEHARQAVA